MAFGKMMRSSATKVPMIAIAPKASPSSTLAALKDLGVADDFECYTDTTLDAYNTLGLRHAANSKELTSGPMKTPLSRILQLFCWSCCLRCRCPGGNAGDYLQIGGCAVYPAAASSKSSLPAPYYLLRQQTPGFPEYEQADLLKAIEAAGKGLPAPVGLPNGVDAPGGPGASHGSAAAGTSGALLSAASGAGSA